ncbi:MAG: hypothetical protein HY893_00015 [Deltaproteobacteria bacterium]|nr:hypothetical protein [Deltaproteobacteria bacterium]
MREAIRPVRLGVLLGLFGLVFGIGWAFWLVLGHERIHASLEERAAAVERTGVEAAVTGHAEPSGQKPVLKTHSHTHGGDGHNNAVATGEMKAQESHGAHKSPVMELAHTRLVRGHLHAMGLGLAAVLISLVVAGTSAKNWLKTVASISTGLGGLIYPLAWVIMGYRTPSLGSDAAEASVMTIAGPGVALVLLGISIAAAFLIKDMFSNQ